MIGPELPPGLPLWVTVLCVVVGIAGGVLRAAADRRVNRR